jgi:hypothetical protein
MLTYIFLFNYGPAVAFAVDPPSFARVHRRVACAYGAGVSVSRIFVSMVKERNP